MNWRIHVVKLYHKTENEANRTFETVAQDSARLKVAMPLLRDWEVADPQGQAIPDPLATEAQQAEGTPWLLNIRTPFLVPWGERPRCPSSFTHLEDRYPTDT